MREESHSSQDPTLLMKYPRVWAFFHPRFSIDQEHTWLAAALLWFTDWARAMNTAYAFPLGAPGEQKLLWCDDYSENVSLLEECRSSCQHRPPFPKFNFNPHGNDRKCYIAKVLKPSSHSKSHDPDHFNSNIWWLKGRDFMSPMQRSSPSNSNFFKRSIL